MSGNLFQFSNLPFLKPNNFKESGKTKNKPPPQELRFAYATLNSNSNKEAGSLNKQHYSFHTFI